ncbi:MAG: alkaline phosphatase family protein [Gammaproteobacteria bacterium]|nr:alkaline phosphatase family protein [Gammaproteobacteria bacterium]MDH3768252.1 alkaline phosphatase family protein [Gammaproteobacteria bacterium]
MSNKKKRRVVLLGFDGMDYDLTRQMINRSILPNLSQLAENGAFAPLLSVFPPDSIPSWITTYTGLDPSEHGILEHVNYLLGDEKDTKIDTSIFHKKTFWDKIGSETDSRVCVINPFMAYPVWPVNGVMVSGPVFIEGDIQSSNPRLVNVADIPASIGGITKFPNKSNIKPFLEWTINDTLEQADFGLAQLRNNNFDLFFQTFLTTDRIQHHLWRYCDPADPTYPGSNEVEDGIDRFFGIIDDIIGQYMAELGPEDVLLIMSDHGHGMRCTDCFNINEFLRRKGYLASASGERQLNKRILLEKMKNRTLKFLHDHDMEEYISKIARFVPNAKELKKGSHIANYADSKAYASDFAGTNPFGGICINADKVDEYECFRSNLMAELSELEYEGQPIFKWLKSREALYNGTHIDRYPDILFEMIPQLGSGMSMHTDLFSVNPTHKKISGGHKKNGIFFVNGNADSDVDENECRITNMYATILSLFDVSPGTRGRGKSFLTRDLRETSIQVENL